MKPIWIAGTYISKFGELWETSLHQLCVEAIRGVLEDAQMKPKNIEAIYVSNMLGGVLDGQLHLGALASSMFSHHPPAQRIEGACASGGLAMVAAEQALLAGSYSTVLIIGVEKMTDVSVQRITQALVGASDIEREYGSTFPGLYALLTQAHMKTHRTTRNQLSSVSVKNHLHAYTNPLAHFQKKITIDNVNTSPRVADPLRMLDCSPVSDGASAIILTTKKQTGVKITGCGVGMDSLCLADRASLTSFASTQKAASYAYSQADILPKHVQVAEVHDCFSIGEIFSIEDLGFFKPGTGGTASEEGQTTYGGKVVINPSGGLKAMGHPIGATGIKQIAYLASHQKTLGYKHALTHNIGGTGATAVVHILECL